ncbi:unnamed protein product [Amoebophrya sp. A120]|nr:unnamed protein product [Amoebophrya sp. A120]|eukprot:GSA120T00023606001.1
MRAFTATIKKDRRRRRRVPEMVPSTPTRGRRRGAAAQVCYFVLGYVYHYERTSTVVGYGATAATTETGPRTPQHESKRADGGIDRTSQGRSWKRARRVSSTGGVKDEDDVDVALPCEMKQVSASTSSCSTSMLVPVLSRARSCGAAGLFPNAACAKKKMMNALDARAGGRGFLDGAKMWAQHAGRKDHFLQGAPTAAALRTMGSVQEDGFSSAPDAAEFDVPWRKQLRGAQRSECEKGVFCSKHVLPINTPADDEAEDLELVTANISEVSLGNSAPRPIFDDSAPVLSFDRSQTAINLRENNRGGSAVIHSSAASRSPRASATAKRRRTLACPCSFLLTAPLLCATGAFAPSTLAEPPTTRLSQQEHFEQHLLSELRSIVHRNEPIVDHPPGVFDAGIFDDEGPSFWRRTTEDVVEGKDHIAGSTQNFSAGDNIDVEEVEPQTPVPEFLPGSVLGEGNEASAFYFGRKNNNSMWRRPLGAASDLLGENTTRRTTAAGIDNDDPAGARHEQLLHRARALLRRPGEHRAPGPREVGVMNMQEASREVRTSERTISVSPSEIDEGGSQLVPRSSADHWQWPARGLRRSSSAVPLQPPTPAGGATASRADGIPPLELPPAYQWPARGLLQASRPEQRAADGKEEKRPASPGGLTDLSDQSEWEITEKSSSTAEDEQDHNQMDHHQPPPFLLSTTAVALAASGRRPGLFASSRSAPGESSLPHQEERDGHEHTSFMARQLPLRPPPQSWSRRQEEAGASSASTRPGRWYEHDQGAGARGRSCAFNGRDVVAALEDRSRTPSLGGAFSARSWGSNNSESLGEEGSPEAELQEVGSTSTRVDTFDSLPADHDNDTNDILESVEGLAQLRLTAPGDSNDVANLPAVGVVLPTGGAADHHLRYDDAGAPSTAGPTCEPGGASPAAFGHLDLPEAALGG